MSTGFGLFDGPEAEAYVAALAAVEVDESPAHLAAGLALELQLLPERFIDDPGPWLERLQEHPHRAALPEDARALIEQIELDPVTCASPERERASKLDYVFGDRCNGPRYDELYAVDGVLPLIQRAADRAANVLDAAASARDLDEMRAAFPGLGVLCLIRPCAIARVRLETWERSFDVADAAMKDDRAFWDVYRRRLWIAFQMLKRRFVD